MGSGWGWGWGSGAGAGAAVGTGAPMRAAGGVAGGGDLRTMRAFRGCGECGHDNSGWSQDHPGPGSERRDQSELEYDTSFYSIT